MGRPAGRLLPGGRARRDDHRQRRTSRPAAGGGLLTRRSCAAARIRWCGSSCPGFTSSFSSRRPTRNWPTCPPMALFEAQAVDGRIRIAAESDTHSMSRVDPDGRRSSTGPETRSARPPAAARWVLTQYPTPAYAARRRDDAGRLRRLRHARLVPRPARPRPRPGKSWAGARPAWSSSCRRCQHDPDRGRRDRSDPLGRRPHLDQLRRPPQHALGRDLHRPGRRFGLGPPAVRVPRLPRRPRAGRASASSSTRARSSRRRPKRAKTTCWPCSISTRAPAGSASSGWGSTRDRSLHRQHPLRRKDRRDRPSRARPELPRDRRHQHVGLALGLDRRHAITGPDHGRRPARHGKRTVAGGLINRTSIPLDIGEWDDATPHQICQAPVQVLAAGTLASSLCRPGPSCQARAQTGRGRTRPCAIACSSSSSASSAPTARGPRRRGRQPDQARAQGPAALARSGHAPRPPSARSGSSASATALRAKEDEVNTGASTRHHRPARESGSARRSSSFRSRPATRSPTCASSSAPR